MFIKVDLESLRSRYPKLIDDLVLQIRNSRSKLFKNADLEDFTWGFFFWKEAYTCKIETCIQVYKKHFFRNSEILEVNPFEVLDSQK